MAILICSSVAVAQQPGVLSFNYVPTPLNIPCGPSTTKPAEWSPYITVQDNHENRVQVRFLPGTFKYDGETYEITYQFRNGYDLPVRFDAQFLEARGDGQGKESGSYTLRPGAESNVAGSTTICRAMVSVQMKSIHIGGDVTPQLPPPSPGQEKWSVSPGSSEGQTSRSPTPSTIVFPGSGATAQVGSSPGASCVGSGTACLTILAVRTGTRCGSATSVEVDIRNDSNQYLRGYILFDTPGRSPAATDVMSPGQVEKSVQYVCKANSSSVDRIANVGPSPDSVRYPQLPK
jgi:hypothetical protein